VAMVDRWAPNASFPIDADRFEVEVPFRETIYDEETDATFVISGRVDERAVWGTHCKIKDYKTGPRLPKQQEVEQHTQLPLYAWQALFEMPWLETFEVEEYYVRWRVGRSVQMTAEDVMTLDGYVLDSCRTIREAYEKEPEWTRIAPKREELKDTIERIDAIAEVFPPDAGTQCKFCPVKLHCPLPAWVRPDTLVDSDGTARAQLAARMVEMEQANERKRIAADYLDQSGQAVLEIGDGKGFGYFEVTKRKLNKGRLEQALDGGQVHPEDLYDETTEVQLTVRKLRGEPVEEDNDEREIPVEVDVDA
jgi:hypothetical protein